MVVHLSREQLTGHLLPRLWWKRNFKVSIYPVDIPQDRQAEKCPPLVRRRLAPVPTLPGLPNMRQPLHSLKQGASLGSIHHFRHTKKLKTKDPSKTILLSHQNKIRQPSHRLPPLPTRNHFKTDDWKIDWKKMPSWLQPPASEITASGMLVNRPPHQTRVNVIAPGIGFPIIGPTIVQRTVHSYNKEKLSVYLYSSII
jgi:hypothetical protein